MSMDKTATIFRTKMEAVVFIVLKTLFWKATLFMISQLF